MELKPLEQAATLIQESQTPVIIIPNQPPTDALTSGLALMLALEKLRKSVRLVSSEFSLPPGHEFLPKSNTIERGLTSLQKFVISVDVSRIKLDSLSYDVQGDRLNIYLTPAGGFYEAKDVTSSSGKFAYDLIITLDVPSLDQLGTLYTDNTEFFYHTPTLNIDHHPANTRFGHTNVVDVATSSTSEIVFELIKALGFELVDEHIATTLLTGIISKTRAFQSNAVTPRSLAVASHLVTAGGRREEIIKNLYQTKSLPTLKLWGRALAKIQSTPDGTVVWSAITKHDLEATQSSPEDGPGVIDELMVNAPAAQYIALFIETPSGVGVHIHHAPAAFIPSLPKHITKQTEQYMTGVVPGQISAVEKDIIRSLAGKK